MSDLSKLDALLHTTYINTNPPFTTIFATNLTPTPTPPIQGFVQALLLTSVCHEGLSFYEGCVCQDVGSSYGVL